MRKNAAIGQRFCRLVTTKFVERSKGLDYWNCTCDCGNEKVVRLDHLLSGDTKSCGCLNRERAKETKTKHRQATKTGSTPEYVAWMSAKNRTTNPNDKRWSDWGGRGIKMCDEWLNDFQSFYDHIGSKPEPKKDYSLDRIDNDDDYKPGNVRWATRSQQATNKRVKTDCKRGHPFDERNTYIDSDGYRVCRTCKILSSQRQREGKI